MKSKDDVANEAAKSLRVSRSAGMSRREFMESTAIAGGALLLSNKIVAAQTKPEPTSSKVCFMNDRANSLQESTPFKAVKVLRDAGLEKQFKKGDTVGIKVHLGEYGNSLNLRPQWVSAIVDEVKRLGGKPVIIECNTMLFGDYGSRVITSDHLRTARRHGFTEETIGCPIWICDGDYGFDDVQVDIPNGVYMKHSFMGKKLLDLDSVVVVTHFKGHPMGGFGGAIKNVGIGFGSKRGKTATHFFSHPKFAVASMTVNQEAAKQAAQAPHPNMVDRAISGCVFDALEWKDDTLIFHREKCKNCMACFSSALETGMLGMNPAMMVTWPMTIADAASGYINAIGKDKFIYLNYAMDITPWCDCGNFHDKPLVPNLGVFASKDPVAVDMACIEMSESKSGMQDSQAEEFGFGDPGTERFTNVSSMAKTSQWSQINAAVYNGLGTSAYTLVESETALAEEFWFPPYRPDHVFGAVHKNALRTGNYDPGDYVHAEPQVPLEELFIKPKGKMG
jgi:uncharacterized protein